MNSSCTQLTRRGVLRSVGALGVGGLFAVGTASGRRTEEERDGRILSVSNNGDEGELRNLETGEEREFKNPANVDVEVGDEVIYVLVVVNDIFAGRGVKRAIIVTVGGTED